MDTVKLIKDAYKFLDNSASDNLEDLYKHYTTIYASDESGATPLSNKDFKKVYTRWINIKKQRGIDAFLALEEDFTSDSDELSEIYKKYLFTTLYPLEFSKFVTAYTNNSKLFKL